ncbi:MAG TPA: homoserine O-succinyltransferase [Rhodopila sp.]|uniref:homoserine O-succinyltransferase MetA n=1 Tax=Rhodopila sp. TaxID=2480087 RepID=UPI002C7A990B|nr:homoserine O-succinyltransferase [Rhodopila sp.]HVY14535.1 homoserine O-succinyltransferase [Rhodopila sp.]
MERHILAPVSPIVIGLVNSMPGEARKHTEQQFRSILSAACLNAAVELRFYSLDTVMPALTQGRCGEARYEDSSRLETAVPDALIVTGAPPQAAALVDEPYWRKLTELVDFAVDHAVPTMWSCLAAHAAVLYLDGIERRRLPGKLSGLYDFARTEAAHPIVADMPRRWRVPHSRYNELPEDELLRHGYRVLSRSDDGGVDLFIKEVTALFVFCQGHPEYDAQTLLREYRRDVRQYLACQRDDYPAIPHGYFGPEATAVLTAFRERAMRERSADLSAAFPTEACLANLGHGWHGLAVNLYANWLGLVMQRKAARSVTDPAFLASPSAPLVTGDVAPVLGQG